MPHAPRTICKDCQKAAERGSSYCADHRRDNRVLRNARARNRQRRESELKRLYDSRYWRVVFQPAILARDPLCQIGILCDGRAFSTDADHVIRAELYIEQHGGEESFFFDPANVRGACHRCHAYKTVQENLGKWKEAKPVDPDAGG